MSDLSASGATAAQPCPAPAGRYTPEMVAARLDAAGRTLSAMDGNGLRPASFRVMWPDFRTDPDAVPDCSGLRVRPARPSAAEISDMDATLAWVALIPARRLRERQVVQRRAQVDSITGEHRWSWRRIGHDLGLSHEAARKAHARAVLRIADALNAGATVEPMPAPRQAA